MTALGGVWRRGAPAQSLTALRCLGDRQTCDRLEDAFARSERQANLFEISLGQVHKNVSLDLVFAERGLVLAKPEAAKPSPNIHHNPQQAWRMMTRSNQSVQGIDRDGPLKVQSCDEATREQGSASTFRSPKAANPVKG